MGEGMRGQRLGNYQLEALLGEGGMASVYRATHVALGTVHAVKVLAPELAENSDLKARFLREGRVQAQFDHPGIARVTDTVGGTRCALVMELLLGESLREVLERGPISVGAAGIIFADIADALGYAHARGVVHRDIKPDNIFLADRPDGGLRPVLLDFGIARAHAMLSLTRTGMVMGTPRYISPEQFDDPRSVDGRSDVFSLAVVLYEMLAGVPPHPGDTPRAVVVSMVRGEFPALSTVSPAPQMLDAVVAKALAPDAQHRFDTIECFAAAVEEVLRGAVFTAPSVPVPVTKPLGAAPTLAPTPALTWPPIPDAEVAAVLADRAEQRSCRRCAAMNAVERPTCVRCGVDL